MKKRKETKSEIVEKILTKYEINLDELNYDALKQFKEKVKALSDTRQKGKVKYKIWDIVVYHFLLFLVIVMIGKKSESSPLPKKTG